MWAIHGISLAGGIPAQLAMKEQNMDDAYVPKLGKRAVALVHDQLETFKYIGGFVPDKKEKDKFVESGEGLPLSIVTLPDFVLDFHQDRLSRPDPVCSVGGHAGHVSCILMHLLSDEDATHRVHFITRTGRLATMLLDDEFRAGVPENSSDTFKRFCEPFVLLRDGQPRCAYLNGTSIVPGPRHASEEIHAEEHIKNNPLALDAIRKARAIYIGSFKTPDYENILHAVCGEITDGILFLDTARASQKSEKQLSKMLRAVKQTVGQSGKGKAILFVGANESHYVLQAARQVLGGKELRLEDVADHLQVGVLSYAPSSIEFYGAFDSEPRGLLLGCDCPTITDADPSARFRAGVILAASAHESLDLLVDTSRKRTKACTQSWGDSLSSFYSQKWNEFGSFWKGVAAYGIALASIENAGGRLSLQRDVLSLTSSEVPESSSSREKSGPVLVRSERISALGSRRLCLDETSISAFVELASRRRCRKSSDELIAKCIPAHDDHTCVIKKRKVAVMVDLDGTLIDSTGQRGRAVERALATLQAKIDHVPEAHRWLRADASRRLAFFESNVYDRNPFFRWLGLGDFRQQWNHPGWYAAYIVFATNVDLTKHISEEILQWDRIRKGKYPMPEERTRKLEEIRAHDTVMDFRREYESARVMRGVEIGEAMRAFSEVQLHPLKEARDFLTSLKVSGAFNLYVVSEGDPDTQWNKLCSTGLSEFFGRSHVLTTGDVAPEYDNERRQFRNEKLELERRSGGIEREQRHTQQTAYELTDVQSDIAQWETDEVKPNALLTLAQHIGSKHRLKQLENEVAQRVKHKEIREELQVAACVEMILARLREKLSLSFYAAVIRAIMRNPGRPLDTLRALQSIRREEVGTPRMKFAMIGDRQTKDLHPPLELLADRQNGERKGIATIRLLSGEYAKAEATNPDNPDTSDHPHFPDYLALTLAHAKALLLSRDTWQGIECLDQEPPLFNWTVNLGSPTNVPADPANNDESIGVDHLLAGMAISHQEFPVISGICSAFLSEYVGRCPPTERQKIIAMLFDGGKEGSANAKRAARLSSFVLAGALANPKTDVSDEIRFATELASCRRAVEIPWIRERVLMALHWVKDRAHSQEARKMATRATAS